MKILTLPLAWSITLLAFAQAPFSNNYVNQALKASGTVQMDSLVTFANQFGVIKRVRSETFAYDANCNLISIDVAQLSGSFWGFGRTYKNYDSNGLLASETEVRDTGTGYVDTLFSRYFLRDPNGLLLKDSTISIFNGSFFKGKREYEYDANTNLIGIKGYGGPIGAPYELGQLDSLVYDSQNLLNEFYTKKIANGMVTFTDLYAYSYNAQIFLDEVVHTREFGYANLGPDQKFDLVYNAQDELEWVNYFRYINNQWKLFYVGHDFLDQSVPATDICYLPPRSSIFPPLYNNWDVRVDSNRVEYIDQGDSVLFTKTKYYYSNAISILETELTQISVYPNPASTKLFVDIGDNHTGELHGIRVFNTLGQELIALKTNEQRIEIDLSKIRQINGIHILEITNEVGEFIAVEKVTIQP